jgi:SAM-dependent methyltransferase
MNKKLNYTNYFSRQYSDNFGKSLKQHIKFFHSTYKFIQKKRLIFPEAEILEIGSGLGVLYSFLNIPSDYLGIELDDDARMFTEEVFGKDKFVSTSLESFSTDKKYDIIFAFEVLEHLENPVDDLDKIKFLLKPGGIFIGTSPFPFRKNIEVDETHLFVLHPLNWKRLFEITGFQNTKVIPMSFLPVIWRISRRLNFRLNFYISFKHFISTTLIIAENSD